MKVFGRSLAAAILALWAAVFPALAQGPAGNALDRSAPIPYFVQDGAGRTGYQSGDQELARWALRAWERQSGGTLRFVPAAEADALVRVYWADPLDGQYGEMRPLVVAGRRGAAVYIRPDMASLGPDMASRADADPLLRDTIVHLTCVHELGHALGLEHTSAFDDIMYSFRFGGDLVEYFVRYRRQLRSRADIGSTFAFSPADTTRLRRLYPTP